MFPRFVPSLPLLVAALVLPTAALMASPVEEPLPTMAVAYADLDLSAPAGAAALKARVLAAAKLVCGSADTRDLRAMSQVETCRRTALTKAAPQVEIAMAKAQDTQRYAQISASTRNSAR